jgi:hypothetical protein
LRVAPGVDVHERRRMIDLVAGTRRRSACPRRARRELDRGVERRALVVSTRAWQGVNASAPETGVG